MKNDDYYDAVVCAALRADDDAFARGMTLLQDNPQMEFVAARRPGRVSCGGIVDDEELGFFTWLRALRGETIACVAITRALSDSDAAPAHALAAFVGGNPTLLVVRTAVRRRCFVLQIEFPRSSAVSPDAFFQWLAGQAEAPRLERAVVAAVNASRQLNNEPPAADVRAFFRTRDGVETWDRLGNDIVRAVQVAARAAGVDLRVDEKLFYRNDSDEQERAELAAHGDERAFVADAERLFLRDGVSPAAFCAFVDAQACADEAWRRLAVVVQDMGALDSGDVRAHFASMAPDELRSCGAMFVLPVQQACRHAGVALKIPETLTGQLVLFMELVAPEHRADAFAESERIYLVANDEDWQYMCFTPVNVPDDARLPPRIPLATAQREYADALAAAEAFAKEIDANECEAFSLARFALSAPHIAAGHIDAAALIAAPLAISDRAREIWSRRVALLEVFTALGVSPDVLRGLLSISIGDVFGGMGSWNDIGYGDERHAEISAALYRALTQFFVSLLSDDT
jgi:hypothetical protein